MATAARERLEARISAEEKQLLEEAASRRGQTLSAFVVASAHEAAIKTLESFHVLALAREDQEAFAAAVLHPRSPSVALKRSVRRYLRETRRR